jgi:hypothetical protein
MLLYFVHIGIYILELFDLNQPQALVYGCQKKQEMHRI